MKKQAAVEWLEEKLKESLKGIILNADGDLMESLFIKAKEMEREQIINAVDGFPLDKRHLNGEEYYEQTYGGEKKEQKSNIDQPVVSGAVALLKFLKEEQQKQYADAKDYMTANQHQYYEEGCDAVLQLIEMRFGN